MCSLHGLVDGVSYMTDIVVNEIIGFITCTMHPLPRTFDLAAADTGGDTGVWMVLLPGSCGY